jgi:hypothetical protein
MTAAAARYEENFIEILGYKNAPMAIILCPKQLNNPDTQKIEYYATVAVGRRSEVGITRLYTVTWM